MNDFHNSTEHKQAGKTPRDSEARKHTLCLTGGDALTRMLALYETQVMFGMGGFQVTPSPKLDPGFVRESSRP